MTIVAGIRRLASPLGALVVASVVASGAGMSCDSTGDDAAGGAASTSSATTGAGGMKADLGMNDVTFLMPLPTGDAPVLLRASDPASDGLALLPKALVDQASDTPTNPGAIGDVYQDLQVVAVRFDLCDRATAEPCSDAENARFRLVFQPVTSSQAFDLGFHVFYEVPKADIADVVAELRSLSKRLALPTTTALQVNPLVGVDVDYTSALRALVAARCTAGAIVRVTVMGQEFTAAALRWIFHGIEKDGGGAFVEIPIAAGSGAVQEVLLLGKSSYDVTPAIDAPSGFQLALSETDFAAATIADQTQALNALLEIDHPTKNVPNTVQCAACHLSTILLAERAASSGIDPGTLPGSFATPYDTSVAASKSAEDTGLLRGLGWRGTTPAISQRVANETAQVLQEIGARY